jgi:two-component system, OmpR family, response regulator
MNEDSQAIDPTKYRILIVEDDALMSGVLEGNLTERQYKTAVVTNAEKAREALSKDKFDAILLDIILPGMNGFDLLKELKADDQYKDIPVIIISNLGQKKEVAKGLQAGAVYYIIKANVFPEEIVQKVEKALKKKEKP